MSIYKKKLINNKLTAKQVYFSLEVIRYIEEFFDTLLLCTKNKKSLSSVNYRDFLYFIILSSGETGIRTPGTSQYNGFQDRRNRPLCHLSKTLLSEVRSVESGAKVRIIFKSANILIFFSRINRIFAAYYK